MKGSITQLRNCIDTCGSNESARKMFEGINAKLIKQGAMLFTTASDPTALQLFISVGDVEEFMNQPHRPGASPALKFCDYGDMHTLSRIIAFEPLSGKTYTLKDRWNCTGAKSMEESATLEQFFAGPQQPVFGVNPQRT